MIYAERGNKVIAIKEESIQKYVEQGYTITDGMGTVLKDTVPTDVPNLKKAFVEHKKQIEELTAEIDVLRKRIAELESAKSTRSELDVNTEETPKRTRKSSKAEE